MSCAPRWSGKMIMPYGLSHALVHARGEEAGVVIALFSSKTLCDKACNEFNASFGDEHYRVARIFGD